MNILICYFSGTGNTKLVAQMFAQSLATSNTVTMHDITSATMPNIDNIDWVGIGYPIHAFNQPLIVKSFVEALPLTSAQKVFVFKVSGEPLAINNASSTLIKRVLRKKHMQLLGEIHLLMPYNIMFRQGDRLVKKMYATTSALVPVFCQQLINGNAPTINANVWAHIMRILCSIELRGCKLIGRAFSVKSACIRCGKCVANCPLNNITMSENGAIQFGNKCNLCMRCSFFCPCDAINIGILNHWRVNGRYDYAKIMEDDTITTQFEQSDAKKYYQAYKHYFEQADTIIKHSAPK